MGVDTDSARAHLCKKGGHIYGALLNICASQKRKEIDSKLETGPALAGFGKTHEWSWIDLDQLKFLLTGRVLLSKCYRREIMPRGMPIV